jgi:O6-methylguanine-DNA--protein-cysteine methyltransferase
VLSRVYVDRPIRNGCGFTVIQFSDGTLTVKPEKTRPKGLDQSASPAAREELLQLALEHLKSKQTATKAATSATTKGAEQMKKSKKYDGLYLLKRTPKAAAKPVVRPTTSAPLTKSAPRQAEPLQAEHPPTPWGTMPTLADIAARNEQARTVATLPAAAPVYSMDENSRVIRSGSTLTGYEMAAMKNGVDLDKIPVGVDLTRMDQSAMKRLAHQQLRDSVNETRSKQGLPKLPNETEKRGFTASWV